MVRLQRSNTDKIEDADIIVIGVPDESKSHAKRKGTSRAPDVLRIASNESEFFERGGKRIPTFPMRGTFEHKRIFDAGNVASKQELRKMVSDIVSRGKLPVMIGGDHSLTTETLHAASGALGKKLSLLYFDAHPDFVSSTRNYYGSVLTDSAQSLNLRKSVLIGTRAAEPEEIENAKVAGLKIVNPLDVVELGVKRIAQMIKTRTAGSKTYISVDLDCVDPASAPGVSVPSPAGLAAIDLIYLLNSIISGGNVIGIDIVELTPDYDVNGMTAALAARILSECIASV
ncbi:putative agmatinase [Candidatus Nitrososphaera gargensis Ga9.2]|uniref:Putative agmatinase n=1 Tax=Nitrososphaera gargensis (strain Ga9.2) TaxID=1237085 RepID=K0INC4_NITGG|nr:arginase family protein [Candidatus Nitrososphaera gargensis]AFU59129.1 putative agmatinase [Candidatus Nitrososphaera gargensis Ga9.2]